MYEVWDGDEFCFYCQEWECDFYEEAGYTLIWFDNP